MRGRIGRVLWLLGVVAVGALVLTLAVADLVAFLTSYSSSLGTYTGQEDDRAAAVRMLLWGVLPCLMLVVVLIRAELRRSRRNRATAVSG
ncbi:glucan phosphoethanolaminetransferase (alkaline phosphatase superfamily) [Kitasatospora sp. MAP5-34]|nr:glucan phosphoethanolaminetransferase (alkaline phosphatase superfamily) [Kitasatospora sp. MAP5-34]